MAGNEAITTSFVPHPLDCVELAPGSGEWFPGLLEGVGGGAPVLARQQWNQLLVRLGHREEDGSRDKASKIWV